jgi:FMN-dependent NADH-azoreductase
VAFAGILADPAQRKLGLHQRCLLRLIDALERQWQAEHEASSFTARDPYAARLPDLDDLLGSAYRLAKA